MKRLKRALSLTKSAPRIEESISEIDEYLKDTSLEPHLENGEIEATYNGNNNSKKDFLAARTKSVASTDSGHGSGNELENGNSRMSPVKLRRMNRQSLETRQKRMSLPANLNLLPEMLERQQGFVPTSPWGGGMSRKERRVSLAFLAGKRILNVNHSEIEISNTVDRESFHGNNRDSKLENKREKFRPGDQNKISVLEIQKDLVKNNSRQITLTEVQTIKQNDYQFQISHSQTTLNNVEKQNMTHQNRMKQRPVSCSELGYGKMSSYTKLDKLGEGTYATVFRGKSRLTDTVVALKEIRLEHEEGAPCTAIREVSLLKDLKHANIVTLHDIIHTPKSLTLVFEYVEKDLKSYMDECGGIISLNNVKIFLFQLLRGLEYCHKRKILHRDLKPQNLLINEKGELKLADFGLARAKSVPTKTYSNEVVTLWYRPPDVLLGSTEYNASIDMWGVGCIFFEMVSGRPMFPGSTAENELTLIFKMLGTPNERVWPGISRNQEFIAGNYPNYRQEKLHNHVPRIELEGLELLRHFIDYVPTKRVRASEAMKHAYFNSLGPDVFKLNDTDSIFIATQMRLTKDPGYRSAARPGKSGPSRRLSVLF